MAVLAKRLEGDGERTDTVGGELAATLKRGGGGQGYNTPFKRRTVRLAALRNTPRPAGGVPCLPTKDLMEHGPSCVFHDAGICEAGARRGVAVPCKRYHSQRWPPCAPEGAT